MLPDKLGQETDYNKFVRLAKKLNVLRRIKRMTDFNYYYYYHPF